MYEVERHKEWRIIHKWDESGIAKFYFIERRVGWWIFKWWVNDRTYYKYDDAMEYFKKAIKSINERR